MSRPIDLAKKLSLTATLIDFLLVDEGPKLTMSRLAEGTGIKRPTLYFHYTDLAGVFSAVLKQVLSRQVAHMDEPLSDAVHPIDAVYAYARSVDEFYQSNLPMITMLLRLWAAAGHLSPELAIGLTRQVLGPRRADLIARLQRGLERGDVGPCDPEQVVAFVGVCTDGLLVRRIAFGGDLVDELHTLLYEQFLRPLKLKS